MRCTCVAGASREAWMEAAEACPHATYFHTPYWYDIIDPGGRRVVIDARFDDGASAIVPIARIKRAGGLLIDHFSSPRGTYGGWLSASAITPEHAGHLLRLLISKNNLTFRINPFDASQSSLLTPGMPLPPAATLIGGFTHTLDLTEGVDALRGGMNRGHRSALNVAVRNGVTVKQAETPGEWERYYGLYLESVDRWRAGKLKIRGVYPASLFKRIYEARTGNEILWLALKDGEPVAGALFFYWNRHAVYWHGAASAPRFGIRPNNLLFWEIIQDAARRGYEIFDFNPSGGYAGVESFKERFGAKRVPAPVITARSPLRRMLAGLRGADRRRL